MKHRNHLRYCILTATAILGLSTLPATALAGKDNDTFIWATATEMDTPDLYYGNQREALINTYAMCDGLIYRDPIKGDYQPLLAESWNWADDLTLDVTLRQGVKFHNGKVLDAEDVAYTLNHVSQPDSGTVLRFLVDWIDNVEVVAPDHLRIHAKTATPAALEYLTSTTPIYPAGHYDNAPSVPAADGRTRQDWGAVTPICTGPYKLEDYRPGQSLTLIKNDDYFDGSPKGKPQIGKIIYRTIGDTETQIAELITGGVDWIWGVPPENAEQLNMVPNITVQSAPSMRMSFLTLDTLGRSGESPLQDERVRRAIFHAIDRDAIVRNLVGEGAQVMRSFCVPVQTGCSTDVPDHPYDPEKAKELLAEAGYPDGFSIPLYAYRDRPYSEAVLNYLRQVGIKGDFHFLQWKALRPLITAGDTPISHQTFGSNGVFDASASVSYFFKGSSDDFARDPEVIDWLTQADASTDPEKRNELYNKALSKINEKAYGVPLFVYSRTYAFNSDLDYPLTPDEMAHFYMARWK